MQAPLENQYTKALRKAALARKAAEAEAPAEVAPTEPKAIRTRAKRGAKAVVPAGGSQGDAG